MAMRNREDDGMITKVVSINRVSKTVKGGRIMKFAALVVVGDGTSSASTALMPSREKASAGRETLVSMTTAVKRAPSSSASAEVSASSRCGKKTSFHRASA